MRGMGFGVFALLAGCNAVFDLAPTIAVDAGGDFDHDGILDGRDNCPTVANSDQANGDGDGFGDACDTCPSTASASNHDEDGDFVGDACDVCPGVADFQDDADRDGVGDACDPDLLASSPTARMHRRVLFDGFETLSADWMTSGVAWRSEDDAAVPVSALPAGDRGLVNSTAMGSGTWLAVVGYASTRSWTVDDLVGVGAMVSNNNIRCMADTKSEMGEIVLEVEGAFIALLPGFVPRPRGTVYIGVGSNTIDCRFGDTGGTVGFAAATEPASLFSIAGSPNVRIRYIEVIQ